MKRFLLAGIAAVGLTTPAVAADIVTQLPAGPLGPVVQMQRQDDKIQACGFHIPAPGASQTYAIIIKFDDGRVRFIYDNGREWTGGGKVVWSVDGGQNYTMDMQPLLPHKDQLATNYQETGTTVDLLHALYNGQTLSVVIGDKTTLFDLNGSATAITVLNQCRDAIVAQRNSTATTAAAEPAQPFTPPPTSQIGEAALVDNGLGTFNVRASLNGSIPMNFTLDSGAAGLSIPRRVADQLMNDGQLSPADFRGLVTSVLADNRKVINQLYTLHSLTIAGRTVYDVPCVVGDDGTMMLLGQSVLKKFRSWAIDNERNLLVLS